MIALYGIKNCDTVKKARNWLSEQKIEFQFHDFHTDGLNETRLRQWCEAIGWEKLLNKRSTTWRNLPKDTKTCIDEQKAVNLMLDQPTLIKRPVLETDEQVHCGFSAADYQQILF